MRRNRIVPITTDLVGLQSKCVQLIGSYLNIHERVSLLGRSLGREKFNFCGKTARFGARFVKIDFILGFTKMCTVDSIYPYPLPSGYTTYDGNQPSEQDSHDPAKSSPYVLHKLLTRLCPGFRLWLFTTSSKS